MEQKSTNQIPEIRFAEFPGVRSKVATTITLERFVRRLQGTEFAERVERHRRLAATPGSEAEARRLKEAMPCVIPSGTYNGGHGVTSLTGYSGLACLDYDGTDGRTDEVKRRLAQLPYVALAFTSISGRGVKAFVRIDPEDARRGWERLYAEVATTVDGYVGHTSDPQCKDLSHCCFYSYDPAPVVRMDAVPFRITPGYTAPAPVLPTPPAPRPSLSAEDTRTDVPSAGMEEASVPPRLMKFMRAFQRTHPCALKGQRHQVALTFGQSLRSNYFSTEEAASAIALYVSRFAEADFPESEIRKTITDGYQYVKSNEEVALPVARVREGPGSALGPSEPDENPETAEDVLNKNEELRASMPCLPDELFASLPDFLQQAVRHASGPHERDILLLGSLNACGALFPRVRFFYKDKLYAPCFYLGLVAPAGTGKGVLAFTHRLLDRTDDHYARLRAEQQKRLEEQQQAWEAELAAARHEKRRPNADLRPEEKPLQYFKLPVTTSQSFLIEALAAAGEVGCVMASTEIVTLTTSLRQDYGAFDNILLQAFHHEEVSAAYKSTGLHVARHPCLSLSLSGTQEQFLGLFKSLESGLFSRFAFYTRPQELKFANCGPSPESTDLTVWFDSLGARLLDMHLQLLQAPTLVSFTSGQWAEHAAFFDRQLQRASAEGREGAVGIILRGGLLCMRLAVLLTLFHKWDEFPYAPEYNCSDTDFRTALAITRVLLEHSLLLSTSLPASRLEPRLMHHFHRLELLLEQMPERFTYSQFLTIAKEHEISRSVAKRKLNKMLELQYVEKQKNGYRRLAHPVAGEVLSGPRTLPDPGTRN